MGNLGTPHCNYNSPRPSLNASWSTTSGMIFGGGTFFCDATTYAAKPGMAPGWLMPEGRPSCFGAGSFPELADPPPVSSILLLRPPPHGRQPTHFPNDVPSWAVGFDVSRVFDEDRLLDADLVFDADLAFDADRLLPAGEVEKCSKLSRNNTLLRLAELREIMGRAVTVLLATTEEVEL